MTTIAIYPGRFQPFSLNHLAVWEYISNNPLFDECFIATSSKVDLSLDKNNNPRSPFSFYQKQKFAESLGISSESFIMSRTPYIANEVLQDFDPDEDVVVYIVGKQDMVSKNGRSPRFQVGKSVDGIKKNGDPTYFKMFNQFDELIPFAKHGYIMQAPQIHRLLPDNTKSSGTNTRAYLKNCDYNNFNYIYPSISPGVYEMLKDVLA